MQSLSVVIISFNEEKNIGRCIESVSAVADEIIVLDSFSTDNTVAIALEKGAAVHQQSFIGYIQQKNRALRLANYDLVLNLDADEALSNELMVAIYEAKKIGIYKAFSMNRCSYFCGRFIYHGLWYPDKKVRLIDKRIARWGGMNPHEKIELATNIPVEQLKGDILHYAFDTLPEYLERSEMISSTAARSLFESGKRMPWYKLLFSPAWAFLNGYLLRAGFLDGSKGFQVAFYAAQETYMKYLKLRRMQKHSLKAKEIAGSSTIVHEHKYKI